MLEENNKNNETLISRGSLNAWHLESGAAGAVMTLNKHPTPDAVRFEPRISVRVKRLPFQSSNTAKLNVV